MNLVVQSANQPVIREAQQLRQVVSHSAQLHGRLAVGVGDKIIPRLDELEREQ